MIYNKEKQDKCALCGRVLLHETDIIEETLEGTHYTFDTKDCALMFGRFLTVYGNDFKNFAGQEQYISDPFWDKVIPKQEEIKEIKEVKEQEEGKGIIAAEASEIIKVIKDPTEILRVSADLIKSAKEDVRIAFSTVNAFYEKQYFDIFQVLKEEAARAKKVDIKILTPADQQIKDDMTSLKLKDKNISKIHVRHFEEVTSSSLCRNIILLVVDRKSSLSIKLKEKEERTGEEEEDNYVNTYGTLDNKETELATLSNNKSTVLSYVTIFETLWKELELNERVTNLFEQLKNQENIEKDFINVAAHELRAPIQPVLGLAEVLASKKNIDSEEQKELVAVILRNAKRLKALTENILDHARIESQSLNLRKEIFNIDEVILDALADVKSQMPSDQKITIQYNSSKELLNPVFVEADRFRLMQVVSNLLNNAIKFTEIGTITINLERKKEADDKNDNNNKKEEEIIVSVKDSGSGIDPQIMPKLFTKFVPKSGGTGLGLFISKGIVEAHGGRIWAKNNADGKGAIFSFTLPLNTRQLNIQRQ